MDPYARSVQLQKLLAEERELKEAAYRRVAELETELFQLKSDYTALVGAEQRLADANKRLADELENYRKDTPNGG